MKKVIHVHFFVGRDNGLQDFYFSSIAAIFTLFTPADIGVSESYARHMGLSGNGTYTNRRVMIKQAAVHSCKRK